MAYYPKGGETYTPAARADPGLLVGFARPANWTRYVPGWLLRFVPVALQVRPRRKINSYVQIHPNPNQEPDRP